MKENYLKQDFYNYLKQNDALFDDVVSSTKKYFFVWDYENQNHLWISNTIWKKLGFKEENPDNDLLLWKSRVNLMLTPKHNFALALDDDIPKLNIEFKNSNGEKINTSINLYPQRNSEKKVIRLIGILDNNWNNLSLNYSVNQFEILIDLYKSSFKNFETVDKLYSEITKAICKGLTITRAGIWKFESDKLVCKNLYDSISNNFTDNTALFKTDIPKYLEALKEGIAIVADDAEQNKLTAELAQTYLKPLNIKSILDIPIREKGVLTGTLCCEKIDSIKNWSDNDISFARSIADIFSLFIEENERRIVENDLHENNERFDFISDNITDGIFIVEDEEMVYASKPYLNMIGLTIEEKRIQRKGNVLHLLHPDDVERIDKVINLAIENKESFVKFVFRCKKSNGDYFWREDIMNLYYNISNIKLRTVTITRDITAEKNAEIERNQRQKQIDLQNKLLVKLYSNKSELSINKKIDLITKIALEGLNIDRSNYWVVEGDTLVCKNLIDITQKDTLKNQVLNIRDLPKYFEAMNTQIALIADDVMTNEFTSELIENYLKPLGITDMLDIPVRENGVVHGVLCFEHRDDPRVWSENDITFARSLADFLSLSLEEERRKKVERRLVVEQEMLKFISENTSDGIVIIEDKKISYASPVFLKMSGYTEEFLKNLTREEIYGLIHPDDYEIVSKEILNNLESRIETFFYQYRFRCVDNKYYWREDSTNVIYNEDGTYSKYILISRDVSERKKIMDKLIENEQQLRLITENSSDGFLILENHKIQYVSPSYCMAFGYDYSEVIGNNSDQIFERIHPEDRQRVRDQINFYLRNKAASFKFEFRLLANDGNYYWREDISNVIYDDNQKIGEYSKYIISSRDINARKIIESKLSESEEKLRIISENTTDGIYIIEDSAITYMSPTCYELLKHTRKDGANFTIDDMFNNIHPEDREVIRSHIYDCLTTKKEAFKYELRVKDANQQFNWREDSVNVIYHEDGRYSKYIVVTRDISIRKEVEKEKNKLYRITEKQNQKLINFTHIVSHDIRSHTSNLSMLLDLFSDKNNVEDQEQYFQMMKESTNKLSDTIYYLNETVAIQNGVNTNTKSLNLKEEIEKSIQGINAFIKTNQTSIKINVDPIITIDVTPSYFESIIFNLLTNAIKYKSKTRSSEIYINAVKLEEEVKLTIQDNGIGIDLSRNKDKIFGMYKTFHGNEDAIGLGLFMVKNHIESMGGRIDVESQVDKGTTFNLYFI
ncbi:PAS domain-containing protein [Flavobacterium sp.]|uniref:PAS domain-containing protein n=1 Tax=Flavobacterium sp. TaxID=239 RepID=UPI00286E2CB5|nr:PAS domain-containing protein [Flavobacterium sp.]